MKSAMAVVEWYGPYSQEEAQTAASDFGDGIYMAIGKRKSKKTIQLQYMGLASNLLHRLNREHHKLPLIIRELSLWLGEVTTPRSPGRKTKVTDRMLDLVEWAHIYFLKLPLNEKKKANPPDHPIAVYNRWWRKDYDTQFVRRPHKDWPDLIDFVGPGYNVKLVWFGGRQEVYTI